MNGRSLSLRTKVPLLLTGLTAAALLAAAWVAWTDVRNAALETATARLDAVTLELTDLVREGQQSRARLEQAIGEEEVVRAALAGRPYDTTALRLHLEPLRDEDGALFLVSRDREVVYREGPEEAVAEGASAMPLDTMRLLGPFERTAAGLRYWSVAPLTIAGTAGGWVAQYRSFGDPGTAERIEELIGSDVSISFWQAEGRIHADLAGEPVAPFPAARITDSTFVVEGTGDDGPLLARALPLPGTPWSIVAQVPLERILARPNAFLRRFGLVGAVLLLATAVLGWIGGRRLTRPVEELADAADAVAAGEYHHRVRDEGSDELARLARAFNFMAAEVSRSDEELRRRLTEAQELAERLETAHRQAELAREEALAANRGKSDFLATMSHEIRTPINAVIGYADLLRTGIPDPPTEGQLRYLQRIERASRLLIALVDDVLDFARVESGELRVDDGVGMGEEAVLAAVAALEPEAERKGVRLEHRCGAALAYRGDPQRVEQVLLNLLSNAVKFTREGGEVRIGCAPCGGLDVPGSGAPADESWLRFDVEDTGIGIAPEQLEAIFEPFVQADPSVTREHGGTGLGLAISRWLVQAMGGRLTVESEPGLGSRFTLWIPAAANVAGDADADGGAVPSQHVGATPSSR